MVGNIEQVCFFLNRAPNYVLHQQNPPFSLNSFHVACFHSDDMQMFQELIRHRSDPTASCGLLGASSALKYASMRRDAPLELVKLLVSSGCALNVRSKSK